MKKLAMVRDVHLNPWDVANYYGVINDEVELYLCGKGPNIDWEQIMLVCPKAIPLTRVISDVSRDVMKEAILGFLRS